MGDFGDFDIVNRTFIIQIVQDRSNHIFKCGGGRKAGTAENVGGCISDKAADFQTVLHKAVANAANQRGGSSRVSELGGELFSGNDVFGETGALDADHRLVRFFDDGDNIEVDGSGKNFAVVVVCVISADLATSRDGKDGKLIGFSVNAFEFIKSSIVTGLNEIQTSVCVDFCESLGGFFKKFCSVKHDDSPLSFIFSAGDFGVFCRSVDVCAFGEGLHFLFALRAEITFFTMLIFDRRVGADQTIFSVADQITSAGFTKSGDDDRSVLGSEVLKESPLLCFFFLCFGYEDRLFRIWIQARIEHTGGNGAGGRIKVLNLLGMQTFFFEKERELNGILRFAAGMR